MVDNNICRAITNQDTHCTLSRTVGRRCKRLNSDKLELVESNEGHGALGSRSKMTVKDQAA